MAEVMDPARATLLLQAIMDEVDESPKRRDARQVQVHVKRYNDGASVSVSETDLQFIRDTLGLDEEFDIRDVLTGWLRSNRMTEAAAHRRNDLFLAAPMSQIVGDHLSEAVATVGKSRTNLDDLRVHVEFPDVRRLVNEGHFALKDAFAFRAHAGQFRRWLQDEADRNRDAWIAYHDEAVKAAGYTRVGHKVLGVAAVVSTAAAGAYFQSLPEAIAVGLATKAADEALARLWQRWKPVMFGTWMGERIKKLRSVSE